jgi:hypothetical protein
VPGFLEKGPGVQGGEGQGSADPELGPHHSIRGVQAIRGAGILRNPRHHDLSYRSRKHPTNHPLHHQHLRRHRLHRQLRRPQHLRAAWEEEDQQLKSRDGTAR